jgi:ketosteroid isomerase-like protein
MSDDTAAVLQPLRDYYAASSKHDVSSMVDYYESPVMVIAARGVMCWATHTEAIRNLMPFIARLQEIGAARTEWGESHFRQLSDTLVMASIVVVRYKADGQELERLGWTYLLHKTGGGWKIAVLASHSPDTVLRVSEQSGEK